MAYTMSTVLALRLVALFATYRPKKVLAKKGSALRVVLKLSRTTFVCFEGLQGRSVVS